MDVKIEVRKVTTATAMTVAAAINACGFIISPFLIIELLELVKSQIFVKIYCKSSANSYFFQYNFTKIRKL